MGVIEVGLVILLIVYAWFVYRTDRNRARIFEEMCWLLEQQKRTIEILEEVNRKMARVREMTADGSRREH